MHRTANINEYSMRYSEAVDDYYVPELNQLKKQSKTNKQGKDEQIDIETASVIQNMIKDQSISSYESYKNLINLGLTRELARSVLSVNFYTEWYYKMDLHNLFNFLRLRLDSHAQWEIQEYARAMYEITKTIAPVACNAFEKHIINAVVLSADEKELVATCLDRDKAKFKIDSLITSKTGKNEFWGKFDIVTGC